MENLRNNLGLSPMERFEMKLDYATKNNMFVDVSKLDILGTGARIVKFPENNPDMMYVDGINIISDNFLGYERASRLLGDLSWYTDLEEKYLENFKGSPSVSTTNRLEESFGKAMRMNKVLDVSDMDEYGLGIRIINRPSKNSNKIMVDGLDIVSNNFEQLERAIVLLYNDSYLLDALYYKYLV
jgi:hypothetical protein